jgi:hypothetical protein
MLPVRVRWNAPDSFPPCFVAYGVRRHGYNFSDDDLCGFKDPTDRENAGDPKLGPLADNGGSTPTLLPQPGSPLIDAIPLASCQANGAAGITEDQRGIARPQGPGCDIGAVEVEAFVPPPPPAPVLTTPLFTGCGRTRAPGGIRTPDPEREIAIVCSGSGTDLLAWPTSPENRVVRHV